MHLPPSSSLLQAISTLQGTPRGISPAGTPPTPAAKEAVTKAPVPAAEKAARTALNSGSERRPEGAAAPAEEARILPRGSVLDIKV
jgi:hypothetical protein